MSLRQLIASALFVCAAVTALAQRPGAIAFRRLPIPEDVPAHLCSAIAQDARGLMWFGTQRGLVRYDGYEFRVHRSNPSDPATLGGNYVRALLPARDGRLWVGTFSGGVSVFDPRTERFTRFGRESLSYDRVEGLAEDRSGAIWIATSAGLDRLDPRTGRVAHFRHDPRDPRSLADDRVRGLLVDRAGRLWVGSRGGLQRWTGRGFERVAPELARHSITRLFEDARGRIWAGTDEHGAAVVDANGAVLRRFGRGELSHFWVYGFAAGPSGEIWIATFGGGIDVVDEASLAIVDRLQHDPVLPDTIGADRVGALFRDRSGVMWVGTWGEGIALHDPRTRAFRALRATPRRAHALTHGSAVRAMERRDGTIWVGTNGNGIDVLDRELRRVRTLREGLSDGAITCLAEGGDGAAWVATLDGSLHRLRPGASHFERVPRERLAGGPIRTIAFDASGNLWAGAAQGMVRIDPRTLAARVYRRWPGAGESSPAIEAIAVARDGMLWVGTDNGLYAFDPRTEQAVRIGKDLRKDGLPENWVPDLMLARDGRLWVGTSGGACILTRWDGRTARFENVSARIGRPPAPAEALIEDASGNVWIGPRLRVDPRTWTSRELGPADGAAFRNYFIASRARTRDGRLLFGSPEGLLVVDPRSLGAHDANVPLVVTSLRVEGRARAGGELLPALALSESERSFALDVAPRDVAAAPRITYRHRLEPLDRDWLLLDANQRSIAYSRLPPGKYLLRVAASTRDGRWSARELRLPVEVRPAFHQTRWFRALVALLGMAALYGAYRVRVRRLRARERELELLVKDRTRELETAYAKIEEASLTDPLTGLRNRRFLEQNIGADLEIARRGGVERDLVILLVDLDHFKSVNDQYGHAAGDAVLVELARLLQRTFRASDHVVRWGGEEFLIVVRFVDRTAAPDLAEKLRAAVETHPFPLPDGTILHRTCSIGVATWPHENLTFEHSIDLADAALYEAKRGGRNAWKAA